MTVTTSIGVSLETSCGWEECGALARPLLAQMDSGKYDRVSLMRIASLDDWRDDHRTARKRADRAWRRGYRFQYVDRHLRSDEVFSINTSRSHRQGRPMGAGYMHPVKFDPLPTYPCDRHAIRTYGVTDQFGTLVAYLWLYRCGDLALVSQILGHADHLENEIMYLLWQGTVAAEAFVDPDGYLVYNRHDSGTDGLRFYKDRVGLREVGVEWLP